MGDEISPVFFAKIVIKYICYGKEINFFTGQYIRCFAVNVQPIGGGVDFSDWWMGDMCVVVL